MGPMDTAELTPGSRITIASHEHAFGKCFLSGSGTVIPNRDYLSREREEVVVRFDPPPEYSSPPTSKHCSPQQHSRDLRAAED